MTRLPLGRLGVGLLLLALAFVAGAVPAWAARSVQLEELTSTELRERIAGGATTVLLPIGGTEQNGPHLALGKHNVRARLLAVRIAERLGNALVAPVLAYVPEGTIDPPGGHMRFAGTISIDATSFEALLESSARSLCRHGLREVVLLGDHGGYQQNLQRVAERANRPRAGQPACRVHALGEYYRVVQTDYVEALKAQGYSAAAIGSHAGLADTALMLALDPALVRSDAFERAASAGAREGVAGDPRGATAALGQLGVDRIVEASVAAIRARTSGR